MSAYAVLEHFRSITPQHALEEAKRISSMEPKDALELLALIVLHHAQVMQTGEGRAFEVSSQ